MPATSRYGQATASCTDSSDVGHQMGNESCSAAQHQPTLAPADLTYLAFLCHYCIKACKQHSMSGVSTSPLAKACWQVRFRLQHPGHDKRWHHRINNINNVANNRCMPSAGLHHWATRPADAHLDLLWRIWCFHERVQELQIYELNASNTGNSNLHGQFQVGQTV